MADAYNPLPDVTPQGIPSDYVSNDAATPNAFGAGIATATQQTASQVASGANELASAAIAHAGLINQNLATDELTSQSQALAQRYGQFHALEGRAAYEALPKYMEDVKGILKLGTDKMPNLQSKSLLGQSLSYLSDRYMTYGQDYANGQLHSWTQTSAANGAAESYDQASLALVNGDTQTANDALAAGDDHTRTLLASKGYDPDQMNGEIAKARGQALVKSISIIADSEPQAAIDLYNKYKGQMDASSQLLVENRLKSDEIQIRSNDIVSSSLASTGFVNGVPDKAAWQKAASDAVGTGNPDLTRKVMSTINEQWTQYDTATASARAQLSQSIPDLIAAAKNGVDVEFPTAQVAQIFPPGKVAIWNDEFTVAKQIGQALKGVQWATPEGLDSIRQDLESGHGVVSDAINVHGKIVSGPGVTDVDEQDKNLEFYRMRGEAGTTLETMIDNRNKVLAVDPVSYILSHPDIQAAVKAVDPEKPETITNYVNKVTGLQTALGVPPDQQHIISGAAARDMAAKMTAPGTDVYALIDKEKGIWGPAWPSVFSDAISLGKLPPAYQAIGTIDAKNSAMLSRTLQEEGLNPTKTWDDRIGTADKNTIDKSIQNDTNVQQYLLSMTNSGYSNELINGVRSAITTLAYGQRFYGGASNANQSAAAAIKAFTGDLTFWKGVAVPTEFYSNTVANADWLLHSLTTDQIAIPPVFDHLGGPTSDDYLNMLKAAPEWVGSPDAKSIMLKNGQNQIIRDKSGRPIIIPFKDPLMGDAQYLKTHAMDQRGNRINPLLGP